MAANEKSGAPDCGLYIRIPEDFSVLTLVPELQQVILVTKRSKYKKNMHVIEWPAKAVGPDGIEHIAELVEFSQKGGFVSLVRSDVAVAQATKADGVLLDKIDDVAGARALLGEDKIVGLSCMTGENHERVIGLGLDYITLPLNPQIIAKWSTRADLPVLADGDITNNDAATYVAAGATFLNASSYIFNHSQGVMQGTVDMLYAIDLALEKRVIN